MDNIITPTCRNCIFKDNLNFCAKMVIDKQIIWLEDEKRSIMSYYIDFAHYENGTEKRHAFITQPDFGCNQFKPNQENVNNKG
jgi:hypothetical protein